MLIKVEKDIIEAAANGNEVAVEVLHLIVLGMKRGKHWYSLPRFNPKSLVNALSKEEIKILSNATDNDSNQLAKQVEYKLIVTMDNSRQPSPTELVYNPNRHNNFEIYEESHLLCENLTDTQFYKLMIQFHKDEVVKSSHLCRITQHCFLPRNGGGKTTARVLGREIESGEHLCLVIADSDRRFIDSANPNANIGDTAKEIEVQMTPSPDFCRHYILKLHREAENLIPYTILRNANAQRDCKNLLGRCDMELFDIKKGLIYEPLFGDKIYQYWTDNFQRAGIQCDLSARNEFKPTAATNIDTYKANLANAIINPNHRVKSNVVISGWGDNVLANAIVELKINRPKLGDLTQNQLTEWKAIGKLLYEWSLARKPFRL